MREIAARGVGIVFISHRLEEVPRVADRVTVFRDGRVAGQPRRRAPQSELVSLLVGRPLDELYPRRGGSSARRCCGWSTPPSSRGRARAGRRREDITLTVRAGEIVGLAGIMGAGRTELLTALYGAAGPAADGRGKSKSRAARRRSTSIRGARGAGLGFVTDDRRGGGLMLRDSVGRNLVLAYSSACRPSS